MFILRITRNQQLHSAGKVLEFRRVRNIAKSEY